MIIFALVVAHASNVMLKAIIPHDDTFAFVISIASGFCAVALVLAWFLAPRFVDDLLLLSLAVWVANTIEYATEPNAFTENQIRQCGFYFSFAILSVGAYVARRTNQVRVD